MPKWDLYRRASRLTAEATRDSSRPSASAQRTAAPGSDLVSPCPQVFASRRSRVYFRSIIRKPAPCSRGPRTPAYADRPFGEGAPDPLRVVCPRNPRKGRPPSAGRLKSKSQPPVRRSRHLNINFQPQLARDARPNRSAGAQPRTEKEWETGESGRAQDAAPPQPKYRSG